MKNKKIELIELLAILISFCIGLYATIADPISYIPSIIGIILWLVALIAFIYDAHQVSSTNKWNIVFYIAYTLWLISSLLKLPISGDGFKAFKVIAGIIALILFICILVHKIKLHHQHA